MCIQPQHHAAAALTYDKIRLFRGILTMICILYIYIASFLTDMFSGTSSETPSFLHIF